MPFILAFKKEMTQRFKEDGTVVPVTVLKVEPCVITQIKVKEKDGYAAVQIKGGKKSGFCREFKINNQDEINKFKKGEKIEINIFKVGEKAIVTGTSKGRGFAGVVKRHHFHGHPPTHGHKDALRSPGSIGSGGIQRVFKGMRMAGRMGGGQVTIKNLEIIDVQSEKGLLYLKGAVPGARNALVMVKT